MKRTLLTSLILLLFANLTYAQKVSTIMGDAWTGIVVTANETTREITLRHPDQAKNETFVGFLEDGYKVKLKDGTWRFVEMSEIQPGARIRVFYKSKTREISGQQVKVFSIHRIDFLGIDKYTRLRESLNLPPSIPITVLDQTKLPEAKPLRVFLSLEQENLKEWFVAWVQEWNKLNGQKYGRIEIAADLANSDVSLVSIWGGDELVAIFPALVGYGGSDLEAVYPTTIYLAVKDNDTLKVLYERRLMMAPRAKLDVPDSRLGRDLEKRLKARTK